jgi:hypothetical protein
MAQVGQFATPSAGSGRRRLFTVTCNRRGRWIARDLDGLIEGVFIDKRTAIRFALFEVDGQRSAVILIPDNQSAEGARAA